MVRRKRLPTLVWAELCRLYEPASPWSDTAQLAQFWSAVNEASPLAPALLKKIHPCLSHHYDPTTQSCLLLYAERTGRAWAEILAFHAPDFCRVQVGAQPHELIQALREAQRRTGVDLSQAEVRVGLTRGHLFEVVFSVPRDVSGGQEDWQIAAELFLEHLLGDVFLDDWVLSVDVLVTRSSRSLPVLVAPTEQSVSYPIEQTELLLRKARRGIEESIPLSSQELARESWIALEVAPGSAGEEAERSFISTLAPEAMKAAWEGLPFSSERFVQSGELFVCLSWQAPNRRLEARQRCEAWVEAYLRERGAGALVGSGFGPLCDYLDLLLVPDEHFLSELGQGLAEELGEVQLHFYESNLGAAQLRFSARS